MKFSELKYGDFFKIKSQDKIYIRIPMTWHSNANIKINSYSIGDRDYTYMYDFDVSLINVQFTDNEQEKVGSPMKTIYAVWVDKSEDGRSPMILSAFFTNKEEAQKYADSKEQYKGGRSNRVEEHLIYESVQDYNNAEEEFNRLKNSKDVVKYLELLEVIRNRK